jgi:hypothetical protein
MPFKFPEQKTQYDEEWQRKHPKRMALYRLRYCQKLLGLRPTPLSSLSDSPERS